jgi:hypothetical protein
MLPLLAMKEIVQHNTLRPSADQTGKLPLALVIQTATMASRKYATPITDAKSVLILGM